MGEREVSASEAVEVVIAKIGKELAELEIRKTELLAAHYALNRKRREWIDEESEAPRV